jgi:hypothetical protein
MNVGLLRVFFDDHDFSNIYGCTVKETGEPDCKGSEAHGKSETQQSEAHILILLSIIFSPPLFVSEKTESKGEKPDSKSQKDGEHSGSECDLVGISDGMF